MSETAVMSLTDFLLARIAEDEEVARAAASLAETPWRATRGRQVETARDGYLVTPEDEYSDSDEPADAVSRHVARHDPARVLAECEAKRRIVEIHSCSFSQNTPGRHLCEDSLTIPEECETMRILAAVYADHPDYRDEWRP